MSAFFYLLYKLRKRVSKWGGFGYGTRSVKQEVRCIRKLLKGRKPVLALDVGANIGSYTDALGRFFPDLEIHLFEPVAVNVKTLREKYNSQSRIHVVDQGVSDRQTTAVIYSDKPGSTLSSLSRRRQDHFGIQFDVQETISLIRLEDYWRDSLQSRHVDILKLDVEGHEMSAFNGMGDMLEHVSVIQFEFGAPNVETKTFFQDFYYFFMERGFRLYRITPFGLDAVTRYRELDEQFITTNYLAVR